MCLAPEDAAPVVRACGVNPFTAGTQRTIKVGQESPHDRGPT
jgi:hypothetical protein